MNDLNYVLIDSTQALLNYFIVQLPCPNQLGQTISLSDHLSQNPLVIQTSIYHVCVSLKAAFLYCRHFTENIIYNTYYTPKIIFYLSILPSSVSISAVRPSFSVSFPAISGSAAPFSGATSTVSAGFITVFASGS